MTTLDRLAAEHGIGIDELVVWVERRWLLPDRSGTELFFTETDRARLRMIIEFRRDLAIDDESLPVVLDLIDRLHAAHAQLRAILGAMEVLPSDEQDLVLRRLGDKEPS